MSSKFELPNTNQLNDSDYVSVSFIKADAQFSSSFNMTQINYTLAAHETCLYAYLDMLHKNASNEVINMQHMSSSPINCPMRLIYKMTKSQPASSKIKKLEHKTIQWSIVPTKIKRVRLRILKCSQPIPELKSKDTEPTEPLSEDAATCNQINCHLNQINAVLTQTWLCMPT